MKIELPRRQGAGDPRTLVLSQEEGERIAKLIMSLRPQGPFSWPMSIVHTVQSVTGVSQGAVIDTTDGDTMDIEFWGGDFGHYSGLRLTTNQSDEAMLRRIVDQVLAMRAPGTKAIPDPEPVDPDDPILTTLNRRSFVPVSLWHDTTADAMYTARNTVIPEIVNQVSAAGLLGTATVGFSARSQLVIHPIGRLAYSKETDCEVTVTARTPDNGASGWGGQAHRDWSRIRPELAIAQAVDLANRSRTRFGLEPGRRTAILGPAAVAQLVRAMAALFGSYQSPFNTGDRRPNRPSTKLGQRVVDPRVTMISEPNDPDGGFPPFFERGGDAGFPTPATTWIDRGVLKNLAYGVSMAMQNGKIPRVEPYSIRMQPAPGTKTATVDEMIASCKEGVYVHRFSNVEMVDYKSGVMTGVTRDGCFFVKNGKIEKAIKNFRFLDSPIFALNKMELIGTSERVAFGYRNYGRFEPRFPRLPVIVPPIMVHDFNFSALADAV